MTPKPSEIERLTVAELVRRFPKTLEVLDRHGVHFCAGCCLTLTGTLDAAAGFHAVEDRAGLLAEMKKAAGD